MTVAKLVERKRLALLLKMKEKRKERERKKERKKKRKKERKKARKRERKAAVSIFPTALVWLGRIDVGAGRTGFRA